MLTSRFHKAISIRRIFFVVIIMSGFECYWAAVECWNGNWYGHERSGFGFWGWRASSGAKILKRTGNATVLCKQSTQPQPPADSREISKTRKLSENFNLNCYRYYESFCLFRRSKWDLIWDYSPLPASISALLRSTSNAGSFRFTIILRQSEKSKSLSSASTQTNHITQIQFVNGIGWLRFCSVIC